jgi:hypothetical protein
MFLILPMSIFSFAFLSHNCFLKARVEYESLKIYNAPGLSQKPKDLQRKNCHLCLLLIPYHTHTK